MVYTVYGVDGVYGVCRVRASGGEFRVYGSCSAQAWRGCHRGPLTL